VLEREKTQAVQDFNVKLKQTSDHLAQVQEENFSLQISLVASEAEAKSALKDVEQLKSTIAFQRHEVQEADRMRAR